MKRLLIHRCSYFLLTLKLQQMIINRLINKGSGKRGRWASKAKDPTPEPDEEVEDGAVATGAAGEGTEVGEGNESTTSAEEEPVQATQPSGRGGWRGRGRRGRGARLPPPPVKMHIPVMRWLSGMRDIVIEGPDEPMDAEPPESQTITPAVPVEREPYMSLSIPADLLPIVNLGALNDDSLRQRTIPNCAISGCSQLRKYKVVGGADPELGACGMAHLKTLQSAISTK